MVRAKLVERRFDARIPREDSQATASTGLRGMTISLALTAGRGPAGMEVAREGKECLAHRQFVAGRVLVAGQPLGFDDRPLR